MKNPPESKDVFEAGGGEGERGEWGGRGKGGMGGGRGKGGNGGGLM